MKFEWDKTKESINIQKHGVGFEEASIISARKATKKEKQAYQRRCPK